MPIYRERTAGIYRCTFGGTTDKDMPTEGGEMEPRWIWRFQDVNDPTTTGMIDKITGTSLQSPNSNAHKMAAGVVGRKLQADDDTDTYIGRTYDVVYGPNQAGNLTITSVIAVGAGDSQPAPTSTVGAATAEDTVSAAPTLEPLPDNLPF